ncbi:hypothetical protein AZE42_12144 [Rhizopogon vesiculosus]|uniref:Uncharacterized protein n=1 Tax=Rhizopogon vesiculosus TaxID=180088 RepID=A0A1J8R4H7_9AGAM|nr:hypothetical protein AZE42_12144 [Rhizopogon vesiculosus]
MRPARRASQQPAEQNSATTFIVPSSTHEVVAPRAAMIIHSTNPLHSGLAAPRRPDYHRQPTMMSILSHPSQTTVHHALTSADPISRRFNGTNSPHTPVVGQFAVAPMPRFVPHDYIPCPTPAGTPDDNTQVGITSPVTTHLPHAYPTPDPYHTSSSLRNTSYYNPMQAGTTLCLYGVPAMGNSHLSYSPPMQNSPHTQNMNEFYVSPTPRFAPNGHITSSSPVEGNLPYRGQAIAQGQSSTSTLNYHLPPPYEYPQINAAVPEMVGNAMRLQNISPYSAPAGTPDDSTQVASPATIWPPHAYSAPDPYHNSSSLRNASYYNPTQANTASWFYGVPAMGNDSQLSYSPRMQSSNIRTPDGSQQQWQSSASYYPPQADVLRSQPDMPTTSTSAPGRSHGSHTQESRPCRWLENNVLCVFEGSMDALKAHFVNSHLTGPQDAQITCLWDGCHYSRRGKPEVHTMRRDSTWRHALEKHLHIKYRKKAQCP